MLGQSCKRRAASARPARKLPRATGSLVALPWLEELTYPLRRRSDAGANWRGLLRITAGGHPADFQHLNPAPISASELARSSPGSGSAFRRAHPAADDSSPCYRFILVQGGRFCILGTIIRPMVVVSTCSYGRASRSISPNLLIHNNLVRFCHLRRHLASDLLFGCW